MTGPGQWGALLNWPVSAIHANLLPNGNVMVFGDEKGPLAPFIWNPQTNIIDIAPTPGWEPYSMFCGGNAFLPDGGLFVIGGGTHNPAEAVITPSIYNSFTNSWTAVPAMNQARWYPSETVLPNGQLLVTSGRSKTLNLLPQVWQPETSTWRDLINAKKALELYPRTFVLPSGKVYLAGPDDETYSLDPYGSGKWSDGPELIDGYRYKGTAVMYAEGKIMVTGGGETVNALPKNSVEVIDFTQPNPEWRLTNPMNYRRKDLNATLLPDGRVIVVGGADGINSGKPVLPAEMWDPATETWTVLPPMNGARVYHSTALLLPDGSVLTAGAGRNAQVYYPDYFSGPRPTITGLPSVLSHGQTITLTTPEASTISRINLVRPGAVTHSFDFDQRIVPVPFTPGAGTDQLELAIPSNPMLLIPGYYMLFILDANGVPSVSRMIQVVPAISSATDMDLSAPAGTIDANVPITLTVTMRDSQGNIATDYRGAVHFASSDRQAVLPDDYAFTEADQGAHTFVLNSRLRTAGFQTLSASDIRDNNLVESATFLVNAVVPDHIDVSGRATVQAGNNYLVTVRILDPFGNLATSYTGTVHFESTDPRSTVPADYQFTAQDQGTHVFPMVFRTAGNQSITVSDSSAVLQEGTVPLRVLAGSIRRFQVNGFPDTIAGEPQSFVVSAFDAFDNLATNYRGKVQFQSSDPLATLPPLYTFTSSDAGSHTFSATLATVGYQSITAVHPTNASIFGIQSNILVRPAAPSAFIVTGFPSPITAGEMGTFTVTAVDSLGNLFSGYVGTIHFTSSDPLAALPPDYTFTLADGGTHTFTARLFTLGVHWLAAVDTIMSELTGSQLDILVGLAPE